MMIGKTGEQKMALRRGSRRGGSSERTRPRTRKDSGRKGKFKYRSRGAESYRERAKQQGGNRDTFIKSGVKVFSPRDGLNSVRILPPTWDDAEHYGYDVFANYQIGADKNQYLSLSKVYDEEDPIEEERKAALNRIPKLDGRNKAEITEVVQLTG